MRAYRLLLAALLTLTGTSSCQKEEFAEPELSKPTTTEDAIVLTQEEALRMPLFETEVCRSAEEILAIAEGLMAEIAREERQTKAASPTRRAVLTDSIVVVRPTTKVAAASAADRVPCANIYLVNFGERAGFAWIAGDKRVQTSVLAYDGSGEFDRNTDNPGAQLAMEYMESYVQEEVERLEAMRGDSIYRSLEVKYGFGAAQQSAEVPSKSYYAPYFPMEGVAGSSPDNPYGTKQGSNWQVVTNGLTWYWAPVDRMEDAEKPHYQEMLTLIYPMIPAQWGQEWPYNTEVVKHENSRYTGCGPTAMAQIMAYHKKPAGYRWNDYGYNIQANLDWDLNRDFAWESKSSDVIADIGRLLYDLGKITNAQYGPTGTGIYPQDAANGFRQMGYSCDYKTYYNKTLIEYSLTDQRPVYMRGTRTKSDGSKSGHAWVIDGYGQKADYYMIYKDCYYQGEYVGYIKTASVNFTIDEYYFHCNWGWNGKDNGWYLAGVFNPFSAGNYTDEKQMIVEIR